MKCPSCGKTDGIIKNGVSKNGKQRYLCSCGREFRGDVTDNKKSWSEDDRSASGIINTAVKPKTIQEASKLFKVDLDVWTPKRMVVNSWDITNKFGNSFTNYQVKVWFEKIKDEINIKSIKEVFDSFVKNYKLPSPSSVEYKEGSSLVEINIADLHLGKLAWRKETGESYDIGVARKRYFKVLHRLIEKARTYRPEKILLIAGNDFFHADSPQNTTSHGTTVDTDVRWQRRFEVGCKILIDTVNILVGIAPVDVKIISGNHDLTTMYSAGEVLKAWFRNYDNVVVDNSPRIRKYYIYKDILLGYAHGQKEKPKDLFALMATEMKEVWNSINFKEFHLAHLHRESSTDYKGLVVRWLKSITGTDSWHFEHGFIGSVKGAEAFVYKEAEGLVSHIHSNLREEDYAD